MISPKRWRLAFRLAVLGLGASRNRTITAVVALAVGVGAVALRPATSSPDLRAALLTSGFAFIIVTALALQSSPVAPQRRNEQLLDVLGAPSLDRRRVHVAEQLVIGLPATALGLIGGALVAFVRGDHLAIVLALLGGLVLPVVLAWLEIAQGFPARAGGPRPNRDRSQMVQIVYAGAGTMLIVVGTVVPASSTSFDQLSWSLWPGLLLVAGGLSVLTTLLLPHVARLLTRFAPFPAARLAGRFSLRTSGGTVAAVRLTAMATVWVVVLSILGASFTAREAQRRASLPVRQITVGLHDDEVIVSEPVTYFGLVGDQVRVDLPALTEQLPGAVVADLRTPSQPFDTGEAPAATAGLPLLLVDTPPGATRLSRGTVALATPDALRALGLERFAPAVNEGQALALDPQMVNAAGQVALTSPSIGPENEHVSVELPAVVVSPDRAATHLPSALVAPEVFARTHPGVELDQGLSLGVVVRLPHAATDREIATVRDAAGSLLQVDAGATIDHERLDATRLDAADGVLAERGERQAAIYSISVLVLAAALLALRFATLANRADDEALALLGARRSTRRAVEAWRATLLTVTGVAMGLATGVAASAAGLAIYNRESRFNTAVLLPPIPFRFPAELAMLAAVPFLAGLLTLVATAGRHLGAKPPPRLVVRDT